MLVAFAIGQAKASSLHFKDDFTFVGVCRALLLGNGIENLVRKAKGSHEICKDAATAALRDLGLNDYNA